MWRVTADGAGAGDVWADVVTVSAPGQLSPLSRSLLAVCCLRTDWPLASLGPLRSPAPAPHLPRLRPRISTVRVTRERGGPSLMCCVFGNEGDRPLSPAQQPAMNTITRGGLSHKYENNCDQQRRALGPWDSDIDHSDVCQHPR